MNCINDVQKVLEGLLNHPDNIMTKDEICVWHEFCADERNVNNGLITKIWGPPGWTFIECVIASYPLTPKEDDKKKFKLFLEVLGSVLPCCYCRDSYSKFIEEPGTRLTDYVFTNRATLLKWYYNLRDAVNKKLGVTYGTTYKDLVLRVESYRARCDPNSGEKGCIIPMDYKAKSYQNVAYKECPVIPIHVVRIFAIIGSIRGLETKAFDFYNANCKRKDILELKDSDLWIERNKICRKMITLMREDGVSSLEKQGEWEGTPSIGELKLILNFSTTLSGDEIKQCLDRISCHPKYVAYVLGK